MTEREKLALALCPCCNSVAWFAHPELGHQVACTNMKCGCLSGIFPTKLMALRAWNTRSPPPIPDGRIAREALEKLHAYILHHYATAPKTMKGMENFERDLAAQIRALALPDQRVSGWQELLRGAKSFGAIIDDPRALRVGFDRAVTDAHRAALLAAINAYIVEAPLPLPPERGSQKER